MIHFVLALTLQAIAAIEPPAMVAPIRVLLVVRPSPGVPTPTSAMRQEVERIWRSTGVRITWTERPPRPQHAFDRVIVVDVRDTDPGAQGLPTGALGGVPKVEGRMRQILFVSPAAVRDLLIAAGLTPLEGRFAPTYARMVGRVVAHELGHLLLDTSSHHTTGLMRETFVAMDALSSDAARFAPAREEIALIRERVAVTRGDLAAVARVAALEASARRR